MKKNIAIVAGGTGLVGKHLIDFLLQDENFEKVYILNRREIGYQHPKAKELIVDFDHLSSSLGGLNVTHAYCTLGTTIKKAGSKEAFKKVDYQYPLNFAQEVFKIECNNFNIVTAMGTDSPSIIFYNQVKYEISEAISKVGFETVNILQPSLLLGEREEHRTAEALASKFFNATKSLWKGPLKHVAGIEGQQVAKAMTLISLKSQKGIRRYPSGLLQDF